MAIPTETFEDWWAGYGCHMRRKQQKVACRFAWNRSMEIGAQTTVAILDHYQEKGWLKITEVCEYEDSKAG